MSSLARITSLLNSGSTDRNLLADLQSIKQQLSDLEDFLAAGAQVRSRVQRLNDGERPSSFFFRTEYSNKKASFISSARRPDGTVVSTSAEILDVYRNFYSSLYSSDDTTDSFQSFFLDQIRTSVSEAGLVTLDERLSLPELDLALRGMHNGKSPGSDGLPKEFYVTFWDLLGPDLLEVFQRAYHLQIFFTPRRDI